MYGPIKSDWKIEGGAFLWTVAVPPNTTATVYVPANDATAVTEGNKPAGRGRGCAIPANGGGRGGLVGWFGDLLVPIQRLARCVRTEQPALSLFGRGTRQRFHACPPDEPRQNHGSSR